MDLYVLSRVSRSHMGYFLQDGKNGTSCFVQEANLYGSVCPQMFCPVFI